MNPAMVFAAILVACLASTSQANAADRHLFYLHGCCIKGMNDPKVKAYEQIVQGLRDRGFTVHYNLRPADVGDSDAAAQAYAAQISSDVKALLAAGVAPGDITIAGYSLGSMTALVASGKITSPDVNVVLLAGCPVNTAIKVTIDYSAVRGRVLSIYDTADKKFGSCAGRLPAGVSFRFVSFRFARSCSRPVRATACFAPRTRNT